jgi:hypothetical protein
LLQPKCNTHSWLIDVSFLTLQTWWAGNPTSPNLWSLQRCKRWPRQRERHLPRCLSMCESACAVSGLRPWK